MLRHGVTEISIVDRPTDCGVTSAPENPDNKVASEYSTDLVVTKLSPPFHTSGMVCRRRLADLLPEVRRKTLTIVKAPAGYGKSSLLSQWFDTLRAEGAAIGWVSIDKTLDRLPVFLSYVAASLQVSRPAFGRRLANLLGDGVQPSIDLLTAAFSNDLVDAGEDVFLFVDNYHLLSNPEVLGSLRAVLSNPPANFHLIAATRHSPPFPVSGLRSESRLAEVEVDSLCFDKEGVTEFLRLAGNKYLSESDIELLTARTEGWAAGLQIAASSLTDKRADISSFLDGAHHHLTEYFSDDIIDGQPKSTIEFLMKTSVLPHFNAELCDAVTGNGNAREQLAILRDRSLFLFSMDAERTWYRYHYLFSKFWQKRLREEEPSLVPILYTRASNWFAQHGLFEEAFLHAIDANDMDRAGEILDQSSEHVGLTTLLRYGNKIPNNIFRKYPRAQLSFASAMTVGWNFVEAERILRIVEKEVRAGKRKLRRAEKIDLPRIMLHRKMVLHHCMDNMPKLQAVLREIAEEFPDTDASYMTARFATCSIYADRETYRMHNIEKMDASARDMYERVGIGLALHESIMGCTYFVRGDAVRAENSLTEAVRLAEEMEGNNSPMAAMSALLLANILYEKNELPAAQRLIKSHGVWGEKQGLVDHLISYYLTKAHLLVQRGELQEAETVIEQGKLAAESIGFERLRSWMELEQIKLAIRSNNTGFLEQFLAVRQGALLDTALKPGAGTESRHEAIALAWCRAQSALGNQVEAIRVLQRWVAFTQMRGVLWSEVRLRIALSVALAENDREGEALRCLREAVKIAAKPRFLRSFIDEGKVVEFLLRKLFSGADEAMGLAASFGMELIRAFDEQGARSDEELVSAAAANEGDLVPEQLNQREAEVLQLVALGLSNAEIGKRLGLTEASVKWYLQRLFNKLDVRRRAMAVLKARKFGLLPS
jgi:LuxR family maltose regulon positive regulatory protein